MIYQRAVLIKPSWFQRCCGRIICYPQLLSSLGTYLSILVLTFSEMVPANYSLELSLCETKFALFPTCLVSHAEVCQACGYCHSLAISVKICCCVFTLCRVHCGALREVKYILSASACFVWLCLGLQGRTNKQRIYNMPVTKPGPAF